jgi:hypothetical protein
MRERFLGNLFAVAISACALLAVTSQSSKSEGGMQPDIEREFIAAVSHVASLRDSDRSTAIVVTDLFKEITDKHQLTEFQAFLASSYKPVRTKDALGNVEFTDINADLLRKFDGRFLRQDVLRIAFRYSVDWKHTVEMHATLLNNSGI